MIGSYSPEEKHSRLVPRGQLFSKGKVKSLNSLFHSVCLVFSIRFFSITDLFVVRLYLWDARNEDKCCAVTHRSAVILEALLSLSTFARTVCLLQL